MIDDATGRMLCWFAPSETTRAYLEVLRRWIEKHGRPVSWYSDRHGIFRAEEKVSGYEQKQSVLTQFSRALSELQIELILANSPQAKGRIERLWNTAQDRLVKELRLGKARTIDQANAVLEGKFMPWFNRRCVVKAASGNDAHRPLGKKQALSAILSIQQTRHVANDYTIRFESQVYQLLPPVHAGERGGKVVVEQRLDGVMKVRFKGRYLEYRKVEDQEVEDQEGNQEEDGEVMGVLPPSPRGLAPKPISAARHPSRGRGNESTRPAADRSAGCSGRAPAAPYRSVSGSCGSGNQAFRPASDHPWR